MKKRKYNPNKRVNSLLTEASKRHNLSMTFDIDHVNESVDKWRKDNLLVDGEPTPAKVAYEAYKGDLIIALKYHLIPLVQEWRFGVDSYFYNYETDEVISRPAQFILPEMSFQEFRHGNDCYVDRGDGLKTRWKGVGDELDLIIADVPKGFKRIKSEAMLSVTTKFNSVEDYAYFKSGRRLRGWGV